MKNIILNFLIILLSLQALAQMPTDGNYSNWEWEDQSQDNWKRKDGNIWVEINPPFKPETERIGEIVDIYATQDYTKTKGWQLVWAQFDGVYPYFILYNNHKSIIRAFFYLDEVSFDHVLATLSFHDINNPGILTFGEEHQTATDQYLDGSNLNDDLISVIVPFVGADNWCSADFPIMFDNNIQNSRYNSKKWAFKFYGCENYQIQLKGQLGPASTDQHTITGKKSDLTTASLSAEHSKLHKQLETNDKFMLQMQKSVKEINGDSPEFLQSYASLVQALKPVSQVFSAAVGISSGVGAVLGFLKIVSGTFDDSNSSKPAAVIQYLDLVGTMDIELNLGGNTLKIPGVNGSYFPVVNWDPYDCPMGYFNLEKTPTIKKTTAYDKYEFSDDDYSFGYKNGKIFSIYRILNFPMLLTGGTHSTVSGYPGKFVKYKFEDDNVITINQIPGLTLKTIHFALVCKANGTGNRKYKIDQKTIALRAFADVSGREYPAPIDNPVYNGLEKGLLKVYKFDEENDEIYFGTPELTMNRLKDIIIEVPEDTEVKLRVIAQFTSDKYEKPIIFQANYNMNVQTVTAEKSVVWGKMEQPTFPFSDYYSGDVSLEFNSTKTGTYNAHEIVMKAGFIGKPNYTAIAADIYPLRGNTQINYVNFNCGTPRIIKDIKEFDQQMNLVNQSCEKSSEGVEQNAKSQPDQTDWYHDGLVIYPNPNKGTFTVSVNDFDQKISQITIVNAMGAVMYIKNNIQTNQYNISIDDIGTGIYFVKTVLSNDKTIIKRIIVE